MSELKRTPLHAAHLERGARMVDFGGWHMPVQYSGIMAEHAAVRSAWGIFDVSHMGEVDFLGSGARAAVQRLVTNDIDKLSDGKALYTCVCQPDGGIVDDCIVYRRGEHDYRIVVNASNIEKDFGFFREHAANLCDIVNHSDDVALIAVQGPLARNAVARLASPEVMNIGPFHFAAAKIAGVSTVAARTGYTGEDGFELFVDSNSAARVWNALLEAGASPIGLGARDTLRLEARLCLYGNDIDATTSPLEAGLGWVVKLDKPEFVGKDALVAQKAAGIPRKLIGFRIADKNIVRHGAEILDDTGVVLGEVTSGGVAPTVGGSIGLGYVPRSFGAGTVQLRQRGKTFTGELVQGPFYKRASTS